jgi:D-3-phosphoglycerate dehydrogenase
MEYKRVAIIGSQHPLAIRKVSKKIIDENGFHADILEFSTRNIDDYYAQLEGYSVILSSGESFSSEAIRHLANHGLELISRCGIGTDEIDHLAATESGIAICNTSDSLSTVVAECTMALILNLMRNFINADADLRKGMWNHNFDINYSTQLENKTIGLIGFGNIAKALAKMLSGFDCRILSYDINFDNEAAGKYGVVQSDIETIQKEADLISLHLPAVPETIGMVNMEFLLAMKQTAILINTARGKLVIEEDLIRALQTGIISGAGLDVYESEPLLPDNPMIGMKNVMLLPHIAYATNEALEKTYTSAANNAVDFLAGKQVPTILNPTYTI